MSRSPDSQRGTYLPTGWRVVGDGAERLAEHLAAAAMERLAPGEVSSTLYAVQCITEPVVRGRPTVERVLEAATEEIRRVDDECPRLVRDEEVTRPPSRFGGLRFERMSEPGKEWVGELLWRAVHPVVAGAPVTTHVVIEERPSYTRLSVRVTADEGLTSVRGYVGAGQAQPAFLRALRPDLTPVWTGDPLQAHVLLPGGVPDFVRSILEAKNRDVPVAVLAPLESGGFVVDPDDLAWDLLGRARLFVMPHHRQTFDLSDAVGDRRMSCYWGAVRCYLPGWSRHDDPFQHPLLVGERLADPVLRATWLGEVGLWMGRRVQLPPSIEERRAPDPPGEARAERARSSHGPTAPAVPPRRSGPGEGPTETEAAGSSLEEGGAVKVTGAAHESAPLGPTRAGASPLIEDLVREVRGLASLVSRLTDEVERLRTSSSVRASSTNAIERRLGRLEDILEQAFPGDSGIPAASERLGEDAHSEPDSQDEGRPTLLEVVQDSAESHSDVLVFLDSAYGSAAESPYEDPERVRAILEAMARVARRRRDGVLGTSLREAFGDLGIDYRAAIARSTPARLREQYRFMRGNGELVEAEEHIVLGNTYDPRRCLRIYFSSRVPNEPRFVIGHVGRHFKVQSST